MFMSDTMAVVTQSNALMLASMEAFFALASALEGANVKMT
jgi:hypothetical protein